MHPTERKPIPPERMEAWRAAVIERGGDLDALTAKVESKDFWANDRYVCHVDRREDDGSVMVLSFHRRDRKPIRDWRDMQQIKNDIAGLEIEGVELFPADSRLMDTANEYWLWCLRPGERWPFGFVNREVSDESHAASLGAKQRPLREGAR